MEGNKFELGQVVATKGVDERMKTDSDFKAFCFKSLARHATGDWGDMCAEDKETNEEALRTGEARLFSAYIFKKPDDKIWIITEWDKSYTTILFPDEY